MGDVIHLSPPVTRQRLVEASWKARELALRAKHDRGCNKARSQTDEFNCNCSVAEVYREIVLTLEAASEELLKRGGR